MIVRLNQKLGEEKTIAIFQFANQDVLDAPTSQFVLENIRIVLIELKSTVYSTAHVIPWLDNTHTEVVFPGIVVMK